MPSPTDYLLMALEQAQQGRGSCAPNPAVGAVLVRGNNVISEGYHGGPGLPHAEVEALKNVADARGTTLYVTLEPCCHFGRTPPCTGLLIEKKVAKVVYAEPDPNPVVDGKGERELRAAGIAVERVSVPAITEFYDSYRHWTKRRLPRVTLKLAMSLDGKVSPRPGQKFQLTGEQAARFTHEGRKKSDAILTSTRTILADDPALNVRLTPEPVAKPVYVLGKEPLPPSARLFQTAKQVSLLSGDLGESLAEIGRAGVHDLWVEAGPRLAASLLRAGLVHRAYFLTAPVWLGEGAVSALEGVGEVLAKARARRSHALGADACLEVEF